MKHDNLAYLIFGLALGSLFTVIAQVEDWSNSYVWQVFAALIIAGATLLVAFVAYPRQKKADRLLKEAEEKRQSYIRFFDSAEKFSVRLNFAYHKGTSKLPEWQDFSCLDSAKDELGFRASKEALGACAEFVSCLEAYREAIIKKWNNNKIETNWNAIWQSIGSARESSILQARLDAGLENLDADGRAIFGKFYRQKITR